MVLLDLHAWSREAEALACLRACLPRRDRGGSTGNTRKALERLTGLCEAAGDEEVGDCVDWLNGWCRKAEIVLGERESVHRLPRLAGERESVCPWCGKDTLRQLAQQGVIFCCDVSCTDEEGRRPRAQLEMFKGEFVLRWMDGILGTP